MKLPDIPASDAMNWADYWDSLTDEYFALRAAHEAQPLVTAKHADDGAAFVKTLQELAQETV